MDADQAITKRPKTLDEFGCWLNCWADRQEHRARMRPDRINTEWRKGYERAVADIMREFEKLQPGWEDAWREWTRRRA